MERTIEDFRKQHGPFARAAFMIDNNFHTEALLFIARYYGLTSYEQVFQAIVNVQKEDYGVGEDLLSVRTRWSKQLRGWIDQNIKGEHPDEYAQLRGLV